MPDDLTA